MAEAIQSRRKTGWGGVALGLMFWLPLLSGILSRIIKHSVWFRDYGAVACGAEKWLQGRGLYDQGQSCADLVDPLSYIYPPYLAQALAEPVRLLGQERLLWIYASIYALALIALLWLVLRSAKGVTVAKRSWFAGFLTGSTVYWGNVAIIAHALIGVCAVALRKHPLALIAAIAVAAAVKPVFLIFAVVFVLMPWPLWRRFAYLAACIGLGAAPTGYFLVAGGALAEQWREIVVWAVYTDKIGDGFFGWLSLADAPPAATASSVAYLGFAGAATLAALLMAEALKLDLERRVLLGLSLAVMLIPRLMPYDFWLIGPGLLGAAAAASAIAPRASRWVERFYLGGGVIALAGNLADQADWSQRVAMIVVTLAFVGFAGWIVFKGLAAPRLLWLRIWSGSDLSAEPAQA
ncbi:MAG TPA: hypothetical protein VG841_15255 [Caulobacterales bacterium]|nr:hypothetical protein [Caulobacterales bacterium]